jgi:hypothetical protein
MAIPSLAGAFAKLERASEHLDLFGKEAEHARQHAKDDLVLETFYDPTYPRFLVKVTHEPLVPLRLSTIAGDVIQNLRSALDHLAYQLPILATGTAWEGTQWPIVGTFEAIENTKRFRGLRDRLLATGRWDLWATVESYQAVWYEQQMPPPEGVHFIVQRYRDLPLLVLNDLSNQDKHKLLLEPYFAVKEYTDINVEPVRDCQSVRLVADWGLMYALRTEGPVLMQFTADITGPAPEIEVKIDFVTGPINLLTLMEPAFDYLGRMRDAVGAVLVDFAAFF